jgi:hypothetical protein
MFVSSFFPLFSNLKQSDGYLHVFLGSTPFFLLLPSEGHCLFVVYVMLTMLSSFVYSFYCFLFFLAYLFFLLANIFFSFARSYGRRSL